MADSELELSRMAFIIDQSIHELKKRNPEKTDWEEEDSIDELERSVLRISYRALKMYEHEYGKLPDHDRTLDFMTEKLMPDKSKLRRRVERKDSPEFHSIDAISSYIYFGLKAQVESAACASVYPHRPGRYDVYMNIGADYMSIDRVLPTFSLSQHGQNR